MSNTSSQEEVILSFKRQATYVNIFFISLLGIAIIFINGLMMYTLIIDPHRSFNRPKIALDFWHFCSAWLMGFLLAPLMITDQILNYTADIKSEILRILTVAFTQFFFSNCGLINTISILEGVSGVTNPHWSRKTFTRKNIKIFLVVIFTVDFLYQCLIALNSSLKLHSIIFVHVFVVIPLIVDSAVFLRAYGRIRRPKNGNSIQDAPSTFMKEKLEMTKRRNKKIAANFIKTIIAFFTPYVVSAIAYYAHIMLVFLYDSSKDEETRWRIVLGKISLTLIYIYPTFNALALAVRIPEYRKSSKCILSRVIRARNTQS